MKTFLTPLALALIIIICSISATLYLKSYYIPSAILTILWIASISFWISSNGFYERKKAIANK